MRELISAFKKKRKKKRSRGMNSRTFPLKKILASEKKTTTTTSGEVSTSSRSPKKIGGWGGENTYRCTRMILRCDERYFSFSLIRRGKRRSKSTSSFQFSSVQSLDRLSCRGDITDDSAEILFQSFLQEAIVSTFSLGRDVHSLTLSIQHFLCRPRRRPSSKMP